ncbi:plasmid mobilization protein, partial [Acinetobacter nectaris]|nr:plasmid mobilization protein [Acinetobacter nectaris]
INRIRAENRYELYKPYYELELDKQRKLEREQQHNYQQTQIRDNGGPSF